MRKAVLAKQTPAGAGVAKLVVELEHGDASLLQHVGKVAYELQFGAFDITLEQVDDRLRGKQLRHVHELDLDGLPR